MAGCSGCSRDREGGAKASTSRGAAGAAGGSSDSKDGKDSKDAEGRKEGKESKGRDAGGDAGTGPPGSGQAQPGLPPAAPAGSGGRAGSAGREAPLASAAPPALPRDDEYAAEVVGLAPRDGGRWVATVSLSYAQGREFEIEAAETATGRVVHKALLPAPASVLETRDIVIPATGADPRTLTLRLREKASGRVVDTWQPQ